MSRTPYTAVPPSHPDLVVRSIDAEDIEQLRQWKNAFRTRFFYKDVISEDMQRKWFDGYLARDDDHMFVLEHAGRGVGCIGFRRLEDRIDFYNLIVPSDENAGRGFMTAALDLLDAEARRRYPGLPVMVSVLNDNPALGWYLRRGFIVTHEYEQHTDLTRPFRPRLSS